MAMQSENLIRILEQDREIWGPVALKIRLALVIEIFAHQVQTIGESVVAAGHQAQCIAG